jgi:hypothetical protein
MAFEPDRVVVELIAKTDNFDGTVKQTAAANSAAMDKIIADQARAEAAVSRASSNRVKSIQNESAKITQVSRLLGTQITDIGSLLSSTASPFVAVPKQAPQVAGAFKLVSAGASVLGGVLGGAVAAGASIAAAKLLELILKTGDESKQIDDLVGRLKEHAEATRLSREADERWTASLDGLIDRQRTLNEQLEKRLTTQGQVDAAALRQAQSDVARISADLEAERKTQDGLRAQLAAASTPITGSGHGAEAAAGEQARKVAEIQAQIRESERLVGRLEASLTEAQGRITRGQIIAGEAAGAAMVDLTASARAFSEQYTNVLRTIEKGNPTLTPFAADINAAADALKNAASEAASAGVDFHETTNKLSGYDRQLNLGQIKVKDYTAAVLELAKALHEQAEAAKNAKKETESSAISGFKSHVFGAEGTGPNQMGSSAAGHGQFMPSTWLTYFNSMFPDKRDLTDAAKLNFRNVKDVAAAVIDRATNDYVAFLKKAGQSITQANLYTVHLLGEPDAGKFFKAAPNTPTSQVLGQGVLNGNPFLKGTVASAKGAIAQRIGDASPHQDEAEAAIARANEELARQAEAEVRRRQAFAAEVESVQQGEIDARQSLMTSAEEIAKLELAAIELSRTRYNQKQEELVQQYEASQGMRGLSRAEADELIKLNNERAKLRAEVVQRREDERKLRIQEAAFRNASQVQDAGIQNEEELLRSRESIAKTAAERSAIELRLVDLQYTEEKLQNDRIIAYRDWLRQQANINDLQRAEAEAAATAAEQRNATIDERRGNAVTSTEQGNRSPLQAYFGDIQAQADDINTAFEQIAAGGLATFTDKLADAIVNFKSLGDVGRAVLLQITTDLVKLAIRLVLNATIGKLVGAATTTATAAQATAAAAAWAPAAAMASLATLGANAAPAAAALTATNALALGMAAAAGIGGAAGFAGGGRIIGPGSSTSDSIPINASADEFMIRAASARKVGYDVLEHINDHGKLPGFASGGRISRRPSNDRIVPAAGGGFGPNDMSHLRGIVSEAVNAGISAMPDIALYASFDPADVMRRALGTPAGVKALVAALGQNKSQAKAAIG